ncbi:MAG: HD domain-containing protein [Polyangiales bacterium]
MSPDVLTALTQAARAACEGADAAHDWQHVTRVRETAVRLARHAGASVVVCELAALLHELFNYPKGHPDSKRSGEVCAERAAALMFSHGVDPATAEAVRYAIAVHPFSLGVTPDTLEAKVLQDADRLDAIGAIGVARCFATCADMKRPFYDPDDPWCDHRAPDDKLWGVDHFAKKLLRLEGIFHTDAARTLARARTAFMRAYLDQLAGEIRGDR